jgi:glycosyltransferase involved in cell wall biosynthesis
MARIAVVHPHFDVKGGAEMVCLNVLEVLQHEHRVTLITGNAPDVPGLNSHYNTNVTDVSIREPPVLDKYIDPVLGHRYGLFNFALLNRYLRRIEDEFDLVFSTYNEVHTSKPSVLYFHHPLYDRTDIGHDPRGNSLARNVYKIACATTAGVSAASLRSGTVLSNSNWTGGVVEEIYGVHPRTVYPPVDTSEFGPPPRSEQEHGFVSIGRLSPDKNVLRNITIIEQLRERGHDVHLHLVGPTPRTKYLERIRDRAADHDYILIENELDRADLVRMIHAHRYGLHGKEHEHFGIVVAELIAGGALPFVPDSGGQREIVGEQDKLRYRSVAEAVDSIDQVLSDPPTEAAIRRELPDVSERFGLERFKNEIRHIVNDCVS